jgi:hypothetical protein
VFAESPTDAAAPRNWVEQVEQQEKTEEADIGDHMLGGGSSRPLREGAEVWAMA